MARLLRGIVSAALNPADASGHVDKDALSAFVEFQLKAGVEGFLVNGSTGEFAVLSPETQESVATAFMAAVAGRVPVAVHAGASRLDESIRLAKHAEALKAEGVAAVPPYYYGYDVPALLEFFSALASATPRTPFYVYNFPASAKNDVPPALMRSLRERCPNVAGVKDTSQDFARYVDYIEALGPDACVLMGSDAMVLAALAQGGSGAVSAAAATCPEVMVAIKDKFLAGDLDEARRLQRLGAHLRRVFGSGPVQAKRKAALALRKIVFPTVTPPHRDLTAKEVEALAAELKGLEEAFDFPLITPAIQPTGRTNRHGFQIQRRTLPQRQGAERHHPGRASRPPERHGVQRGLLCQAVHRHRQLLQRDAPRAHPLRPPGPHHPRRRPGGRRRAFRVPHHRHLRRLCPGARGHVLHPAQPRDHRRLHRGHGRGPAPGRAGVSVRLRQERARHAHGHGPARPAVHHGHRRTHAAGPPPRQGLRHLRAQGGRRAPDERPAERGRVQGDGGRALPRPGLLRHDGHGQQHVHRRRGPGLHPARLLNGPRRPGAQAAHGPGERPGRGRSGRKGSYALADPERPGAGELRARGHERRRLHQHLAPPAGHRQRGGARAVPGRHRPPEREHALPGEDQAFGHAYPEGYGRGRRYTGRDA